MLNKNYKILPLLFILTPVMVFAEVLTKTKSLFEGVLDIVGKILIPLVFTLAVLFFFWGVAKYIWSEGDKKEDGKKIMVWGIIALFVMSSVWGIVFFIQKELLGNSAPTNVKIPTIGGGSGGSVSGGGGGSEGECVPDPFSGNPCP